MRVCVCVVALLLICSWAMAYDTLVPSINEPSNFRNEFGCGVASYHPNVAVFAPGVPSESGENAWRIYSYTQSSTKVWSDAVVIPSGDNSPAVPSRPSPDSCPIDMYNNFIVVGEPWAYNNYGRVTLLTRARNGEVTARKQAAAGDLPGSRLGTAVSLHGEWLAASAPTAPIVPYVTILRWNGTDYEPHSDVIFDQAAFAPHSRNSAFPAFGASVDIRSNWLLVGAPSETSNGFVYIYRYSYPNDAWEPFQYLSDGVGGNGPSFGSLVSVRGDKLYVSAPGSSNSSGAVFEYSYTSDQRWIITRRFQSPDRHPADEFGRSLASADSALAIGEAPSATRPYSRVHLYRHCDQPLAYHSILKPDLAQSANGRWGHQLVWSGDSLAISSLGEVDVWNGPGVSRCNGSATGVLPSASCCDNGVSIVLPAFIGGDVTVNSENAKAFITGPVHISGGLQLSATGILSFKFPGGKLELEGTARLAGKLAVEIERPNTTSTDVIQLNNLITYAQRSSAFSDISVSFGAKQTPCDRISTEAVYNTGSLSLIVTVMTPAECNKSNNPMAFVLIVLGILLVLIVGFLIAMWRIPALRDVILKPATRDPHEGYAHVRLNDEDTEDAEGEDMSKFQAYPIETYASDSDEEQKSTEEHAEDL